MAVNISLAQFRHANFLNSVQSAMRDSGVPAANLELEITESIAMEDPSFILRVLEEVKQLGVTVAIDDFGTGFSSLSQLRRLKVDRLKIDRAFVQEAQASRGWRHHRHDGRQPRPQPGADGDCRRHRDRGAATASAQPRLP